MFLPLVIWCFYITLDDFKVFFRAALICILGYGLCSTWLTPSFLKITLRNMQFVSNPGNPALDYPAQGVQHDTLSLQLTSFLNASRRRAVPQVTPEDGHAALSLAQQIRHQILGSMR